MIDFITPMNLFCNQFPLWKFSFLGGNSYLLASNFISQQQMVSFNPENPNDSLNPLALFPFFDCEVKNITVNESIMVITTITGVYTLDGEQGSISRINA